MTKHQLPQLQGSTFLTDGGLETTLIFLDGLDLPEFASFPLVASPSGREVLGRYFDAYLAIAERDRVGIVLETPTWRASADWGAILGYDAAALDEINQRAVAFLRERTGQTSVEVVVSGNLGPRGDGYKIGETMSADEAQAYHQAQIASFATAGADLVSAITITYVEEAIGIVRAAVADDIPVVIGFTVETDGRLPSGQPLGEAITQVDHATDGAAAYFMVNCAHPTHFRHVFDETGPWERIGAVRANASKMSHEELDDAPDLDRGDETELADEYVDLHRVLPNLAVVGGCCGTDHHHIDAISTSLATAASV